MKAKRRILLQLLTFCLFLLLLAKIHFRNHQEEELLLSDWFNPR
ncbi:mCG129520 [Mus musculus]|nr:mCG129520 [Mus musculus]